MKKWTFAILAAVSLFASSLVPATQPVQAAALLASGSQNGDVWDLQYRLSVLGYYPHSLDGVFGPQTTAAVRRFQSDYGMAVDGVVGSQTWAELKKISLDQNEMDILAHTIYSEARGEPFEGQVAVGAVVMNRIKSPQFPDTIRGVVFQPGAFSSVSDGQFWLTPNATAYKAAFQAVAGWDPSGHALYYFNPQTATSSWIWTRPQIVTIGHHIFTR